MRINSICASMQVNQQIDLLTHCKDIVISSNLYFHLSVYIMVLFVYNHGSFVYSRSVMNQLFTFLHRGSFTFFSYYSLYSSFVYTFRDICRRIIRTSLTNTSIIEYFYILIENYKRSNGFFLYRKKEVNPSKFYFYYF